MRSTICIGRFEPQRGRRRGCNPSDTNDSNNPCSPWPALAGLFIWPSPLEPPWIPTTII
jgi:hypothetical protein